MLKYIPLLSFVYGVLHKMNEIYDTEKKWKVLKTIICFAK